MDSLAEFKRHLRPGQVARRADLARFSSSVDRHLQQLVKAGDLQKVSPGVYYYPKQTRFGALPPEEKQLIRSFLKDDNFYIASLNAYNSLGVGTTQLYNQKLVYNFRRDGVHTFGAGCCCRGMYWACIELAT